MLLGYVELEEMPEIYEEVLEKGIESNRLKALMVVAFVELKNFDIALKTINQINANTREEIWFSKLFKGICYYEMKRFKKAISIFKNLIDEDLNIDLEFIQYFCMVLTLLDQSRIKQALEIFHEIEIRDYYGGPFSFCLDFAFIDNAIYPYIENALKRIEKSSKDKSIKAKAKTIRIVIADDFQSTINLSKKRILNDLKYAIKYLPPNKAPYFKLIDKLIEEDDRMGAHSYALKYLKSTYYSDIEDQIELLGFSYISDAPENEFKQIITDIKECINKGNCLDIRQFIHGPILHILLRLFKEKDYSEICELTDLLGNNIYNISERLFEIAYSYAELNNLEKATICYSKYLEKHPEAAAAHNNLGVIYEKKGEFSLAKELFEHAFSLDKTEPIYKRNLERLRSYQQSGEAFFKESHECKSYILALWENKDFENLINKPKIILESIHSLAKPKAKKAIDYLVKEKYLIDRDSTSQGQDRLLFRINPFISERISELQMQVEKNQEVLDISSAITLNSLRQIGYDDYLKSCLKKVNSQDLQFMLKRDLHESALAILTKSYKSALVMTGSMIEAILLDVIKTNGISSYKLSQRKINKSVHRMQLNELLEVADSEKIISSQFYHLTHALRGFRNLIHPGLEQRKRALKISEQNAKIAWDILRKLLIEL